MLTENLKKLYPYKGDDFLISVLIKVTNINGALSAENLLTPQEQKLKFQVLTGEVLFCYWTFKSGKMQRTFW